MYYCLVGDSEEEEGIYGKGETVAEAIKDWHDDLLRLTETGGDDHDLIIYINEEYNKFSAEEGEEN